MTTGEDQFADNPYDFRSPVTERQRLIGRDAELRELRRQFDAAARHRPVHVALTGARGTGKTSLLHLAAEEAEKASLLPVAMRLDTQDRENRLHVHKQVFDAVFEQLVEATVLDSNDDRYLAWQLQTDYLDTSLRPGEHFLRTGTAYAAAAAGDGRGTTLTTTAIRHDWRALSEVASARGYRGFALLIDDMQVLADGATAQLALADVLSSSDLVTSVLAAPTLDKSVAETILAVTPRRYVTIDLGPFERIQDVVDAVFAPVDGRGEVVESLIFAGRSLQDIDILSQRRPLEINLICHFIWEALASGVQATFDVTPFVLDSVLAEVREITTPEALAYIARLRSLRGDEMEDAIDLLPYHNVSLSERELLRTLPQEVEPVSFEQRVEVAHVRAERLQERGMLTLQEDRFALTASGPYVDVYLRSLSRLHDETFGEDHDHPLSRMTRIWPYHPLAASAFADLLGEHLLGEDVDELAERVYDVEPGTRISRTKEFVQAAADRNLLAMESTGPIKSGHFLRRRYARDGRPPALYVGAAFEVNLETVAVERILYNRDDLEAETLEFAAAQWQEDLRERMNAYNVRVVDLQLRTLPPDLVEDYLTFVQRMTIDRMFVRAFEAGEYERAVDLARDVHSILEKATPFAPVNVELNDELRDASQALGFMLVVRGDVDEGTGYLEQARVGHRTTWLLEADLAYVSAAREDWAAAVRWQTQSERNYVPKVSNSFMVAYFPRPETAPPPAAGWNVFNFKVVPRSFLHIQRLVYEALEGTLKPDVLPRAIERIIESDEWQDPVVVRLLAWASLTILDDRDKAVELLERRATDDSRAQNDLQEIQGENWGGSSE